jgi:hypothetical protein
LFGTVRYGLRARGAGRLHRDALDLTCITTEQAARLDITVAGPGSDLDLAGIHDVPLPAGERIVAYLDQCDGPECRGALLFGAGTPNGDTLGPPLPIVAGGIGSCIVQWVREPAVAIRANVQTGTIDIPIDVLAYVFVTDPAHPCPRCVGYRCDGGPNAGGSCTVDGVVPVAGVPWQLSQDCPPGGEMAGSLELSGVLTTGTSSTPAMDDGCTTGRCAEGVCTGSACVTMAADPVSGEPICIDERGGLAQACCSSDTTRACFALIDGAVVRLGHAIPPSPAWPDPTFPKTTDCTPGSCTVLAGTFAITSTGNAPTARPGVAAVVVPVTTSWVRGTLPFP